jgi:5,10-methylene-tetrahydrofolate dehydrogenase/methenyl tetrahydrofolate cyclohydrolase
MVKDGVVVIDVGITRVPDDRKGYVITGDVDFENVSKVLLLGSGWVTYDNNDV